MIARKPPRRKFQLREEWECQFLNVIHSECGGCSDAKETFVVVARKGFQKLVVPKLYPTSVVTVANPKFTGSKSLEGIKLPTLVHDGFSALPVVNNPFTYRGDALHPAR